MNNKTNQKVKIAVIGSGHVHGKPILQTLLKYPDVFDIVGYADVVATPWREPYDALPRRSVEDILSDDSIQGVVIETAEWDSLDVAEKCADAGKAIHLDKPAGTDIEQFERILGKLKAKDLPLSMGYMYRSNAGVRYTLDEVRSGKLGEIHEVNARMCLRHAPYERDLMNKYPGGIMYFLVCHLIDLVYSVMGEPEEMIPIVVQHTVDGLTSPDDATLIMKYRNGTSVVRANSLEVHGFYRREFSVCGTLGTIEVKPIEEPTTLHKAYFHPDRKKVEWQSIDIPQYTGRYDTMMLEFAQMLRGELVNPYSYAYEAKLQRMILAACGLNVDWKQNPAL